MVSTSARNAGGPWFDSRSRQDRFFYAFSIFIYNFLVPCCSLFLNTSARCRRVIHNNVNLIK